MSSAFGTKTGEKERDREIKRETQGKGERDAGLESKERKKERRKGKIRKKEGKGMVGHVAGDGRRWSETAGSGRRRVAKAPKERVVDGASVV